MAEAVRFELTVPFDTTVFKTVAISRTLPRFLIWCPLRDSNSDARALASKTSVSTNSTKGANRNTLRAMPSYYPSQSGVA